MKFACYLSSLGDPPIIWSWFCGDEQILSVITNSNTTTYLTFPLLWKYHQKACYCRATSPSTSLVYKETSSNRYILYVFRKSESLSSVIYLDITVRNYKWLIYYTIDNANIFWYVISNRINNVFIFITFQLWIVKCMKIYIHKNV